MTTFLRNLKYYYWMLAVVGLVVIGWAGLSLFSASSSQPAAAEALPDRPVALVMEVKGMYCSNCKRNVEQSLRSLDGVEQVVVNLEKEEARIWMAAGTELEDQTLKKTVTEAGYQPGTVRRP